MFCLIYESGLQLDRASLKRWDGTLCKSAALISEPYSPLWEQDINIHNCVLRINNHIFPSHLKFDQPNIVHSWITNSSVTIPVFSLLVFPTIKQQWCQIERTWTTKWTPGILRKQEIFQQQIQTVLFDVAA